MELDSVQPGDLRGGRIARFLRRVKNGGLTELAAPATSRLRPFTVAARSRLFDWRHRVNTRGLIQIQGLTVLGDNAQHASNYAPSDPQFLFWVFGWVFEKLDIAYSKCALVNFGSGKGRVLLVASEFPFKRIIGVEFARELHEIACQNVKAYRSPTQKCRDLQCLHQNAAEFVFPPEPLVIFMENPFGPEVLKRVFKNLQSSLLEIPRNAALIYENPYPSYHALVEGETMLRCVRRKGWYKIYETPK
jgi:hypothetical protein